MNLQTTLTSFLLAFTLLFFGCSNDSNESSKTENTSSNDTNSIKAYSNEKVEYKASGGAAYSWRQLSGTTVVLINPNTDTLSFIAPEITQEETLVFELEIVKNKKDTTTLKKEIRVIVLPSKSTSDKDTSSSTQETNSSTSKTNLIKSLKLTLEKNSLNVDENTTLKVVATYQDNTSKDVTEEVEWIGTDEYAFKVNQYTLQAKKDVNILLHAEFNNITSNTLALEIYKEINGHRLPPEPNKTLNDSTLLGIDINNNGVRDDVERWIYKKYENKHPVHIDIAMQAARGYKQVLETPEKAKEIHKKVDAAIYCEIHYRTYYKYCDDMQLVTEDRISSDYFIRKIYFNTVDRESKYLQFDKLLSGGSYTTPKPCEGKNFCDFNTSKYEE